MSVSTSDMAVTAGATDSFSPAARTWEDWSISGSLYEW